MPLARTASSTWLTSSPLPVLGPGSRVFRTRAAHLRRDHATWTVGVWRILPNIWHLFAVQVDTASTVVAAILLRHHCLAPRLIDLALAASRNLPSPPWSDIQVF